MKKEEPDVKPERMEVEEKKPEMKTEPKEEEEGGANGSTSSSPTQSRRKSESKSVKTGPLTQRRGFPSRSETSIIPLCAD